MGLFTSFAVSTESADFDIAQHDSTVTFEDANLQMARVETALADIQKVGMEAAMETALLYKRSALGLSIVDWNGGNAAVATEDVAAEDITFTTTGGMISAEDARDLGIEEGDEDAKTDDTKKEDVKKAEGGKLKQYAIAAGKKIVAFLKMIGDWFVKIGQAIKNFFDLETKAWDNLIANSGKGTGSPGDIKVPFTVDITGLKDLKDDLEKVLRNIKNGVNSEHNNAFLKENTNLKGLITKGEGSATSALSSLQSAPLMPVMQRRIFETAGSKIKANLAKGGTEESNADFEMLTKAKVSMFKYTAAVQSGLNALRTIRTKLAASKDTHSVLQAAKTGKATFETWKGRVA